MVFTFFFLLLSMFTGLVMANFTGAQSKASDTERKNDINALYQKLEEYYNENGDYPTVDAVQNNYEQIFPGLGSEALVDPSGAEIQEGDYYYAPIDCTALGCAHYTITADLEGEEDYTKTSLN